MDMGRVSGSGQILPLLEGPIQWPKLLCKNAKAGSVEHPLPIVMATVAAKGASMSTPIALFRNSFSNLIRTFSASAPSPSPSPSAAVTKKPKRKKKKNLFELAQFLPNWGIGYQMAKNHWQGISYQITKINLYKVTPLLSFLLGF